MTETTLPFDGKNADQGIGVDERGGMTYPSASASGHVEIEIPSLPDSPNATERLHARDFGLHVAGQIERSFQKQPYLKSGPQQKPAEVFRHYLACAKGVSLMDSGAIGRAETLAREFEGEPEQQEYFRQVLKPYLLSLAPKRRR